MRVTLTAKMKTGNYVDGVIGRKRAKREGLERTTQPRTCKGKSNRKNRPGKPSYRA